jgi:hypothetical protein
MFVCCSLAIAVAAIAVPFAASKFPSAGTVAAAEERSNETSSFESRLWGQDSNIAKRARPPSPQLSVNQGTPRNQGEVFPLAVMVVGSVVGEASSLMDSRRARCSL